MVVTVSHWVKDFVVTDDDIEFINNLLLERETPMESRILARLVIEERLKQETEKLQARFKDATLYNPAEQYTTGQRLIFPAFDFAMGAVVDVRQGDNSAYGEFSVISVEFDNPGLNPNGEPRSFASQFQVSHKLNPDADNPDSGSLPHSDTLSLDEILESDAFEQIVEAIDNRLGEDGDLLRVAEKWFPIGLMLEVNEGHTHLAEAILDMNNGGPMTAEAILNDIGGLGNSPLTLQVFSMNYALNEDPRFDEVGPAGEVLWYLTRMAPDQVLKTPTMLQYTPISYDHDSLSLGARELELELADEHSPLPQADKDIESARVTLIYPHRRVGTLPINHQAAQIFPTARRTERVSITLVDNEDGEEFPAWIVRKGKYVHGLGPYYTKHALPIGASLTVKRSDDPGKILLVADTYKARSEWVIIVTADNGQIGFENAKRAIGASYDDLLLLGVDDLEGVDKLFQGNASKQQPIASILRTIMPLLGKFTAQGHVHAKTLYSAVNVIRRCPPGPILATLTNNPDFESVGGNYWQLS